TVPDSTCGDIRENSLSCIPVIVRERGQPLFYLVLGLTEPYWFSCTITDILVLLTTSFPLWLPVATGVRNSAKWSRLVFTPHTQT
ncbi:MAG: hypothetical protein KME05_10035, partial [Gloeocapsa sp. UFS-A4-WI-NPMV-4B04]|nr:hypothetical protein [Gloeocapsa sp. UFS-A4-WI-NPMV-4B04]